MRNHVVPTLGKRRLQQSQATEIDKLYSELDGEISPRTAHHSTRFLMPASTRGAQATDTGQSDHVVIPSAGESNHGVSLDEDELRTLIEGFRKGFRGPVSVFFPIVVVGALTAARRGEVLALRWIDLDVANKTLTIQRALE